MHDRISAVHLTRAEDARRLDADCGRNAGPCVRPTAHCPSGRPRARREQMRRELGQRAAYEGRASVRLDPLEAVARLRKYHSNATLAAHMSTIIGLGVDATDIPRIVATIDRYGELFLRRIFTDGEIAYCQRRRVPAIHFAGRFAAKEAAMKALGTGRSRGVLWRDIEVVRRGGPPQLQFHGGAGRRFAAMHARSSLLSITHSDALAFAHVMLFGD